MAITRTAMVDDDGSGTTGTIINNAWKTEFYNQIDSALASGGGAAIVDVPFSAANFTTPDAGCTWTVTAGQVTYFYTVNGKLVTVSLQIAGSVITGTPIFLHVALPPIGAAVNRAAGVPCTYYSVGNLGTGFARLDVAATNVKLLRDVAGSTWPTSGAFNIYAQFVYSIP
jgi:hypothetical protein